MKILLLMFICFVSCTQNSHENRIKNEKIKYISISSYGGEMGYKRTFKITTDSLYFEYSLAVDNTKRRSERKRNSIYKLEDIISLNDLSSFSSIKDGESRQPVDGSDTKIVIDTKQGNYIVINAESSSIWEKIREKTNFIIDKEFELK